jgi:type VI secretion system FHA domain protein
VAHDPPPSVSVESHASDLAAMLAGAGLPGAAVTPDLARNFGQILRVVVEGVMDILQARQEIKEEFQMGITHFRPADNNPLKFSANVDDALHNLLVKRNAAYLGPVEAFADAFEDLRNHQMAMLAGMRVAFEAMLAEFQPDRLEEQFNRQSNKGSLLRVPGALRYWNLYRDKCRDMVKDPEANFRELFGEEFARAYEAQLKRLRSEGRQSNKKRR